MSSIMILIAIAMLMGFIVADAILDYIFVIVYAALAAWIANSALHLIRYHKKHGYACMEDVWHILLYVVLVAIVAVLQYTVL